MWSIELEARLAAAGELAQPTNWQPQAGPRAETQHVPTCWACAEVASVPAQLLGPAAGQATTLGSARTGPIPRVGPGLPGVAQSRPDPIPWIGSGLGLGHGPSRQARAYPNLSPQTLARELGAWVSCDRSQLGSGPKTSGGAWLGSTWGKPPGPGAHPGQILTQTPPDPGVDVGGLGPG
jgi:hypothetical protein